MFALLGRQLVEDMEQSRVVQRESGAAFHAELLADPPRRVHRRLRPHSEHLLQVTPRRRPYPRRQGRRRHHRGCRTQGEYSGCRLRQSAGQALRAAGLAPLSAASTR